MEFCSFCSTDLTFAYRPNFHYSKFQTSVDTSTPNFLGDKTRKFDLDIASFFWSFYLSGHGVKYLNWKLAGPSCLLYPLIGGGIGVNQFTITNFRSTGLAPVVDGPSFGSENQYTTRYRFAYQVMGGLEFRYHDRWALSTGYRWFAGNSFKGPRYCRTATGAAFDVENDPWSIHFKANEVFIEFKLFI